MIRTFALVAAVAAAATPAFAQQLDCSVPANAERNECLALPTLSSQNIGDAFTLNGTVWTVIGLTAAFIILSRTGEDGTSVTTTVARES